MNAALRLFAALAVLALIGCQSQPLRPPTEPAPTATPPTPRSDSAAQPSAAPVAENPYVHISPEPAPPTSAAQVLQRLRERMVDLPCVDHPRVRHWQGRYAGSPQRFANQIDTIAPFMALVLDELDRYRLPGEYALLPIAESWYRPDARGAGDHVGLWQFGRSTASFLGLPVTPAYDGRMDALASTGAAMRYLAQMHNRFGDWKLATAAFNAGPQRLQRLVDTRPDVAFSLFEREPSGLPDTTFEHLAKLKALACLLGQPERFGIPVSTETIDPLVPVRLPPGQSSLAALAERQDVPRDILATLNPAFRKGFIANNAPRDLLAPLSLADRLAIEALPPATPPPEIGSTSSDVYVVRRGDTLGAIAKRNGVKLQTLFQLNGLTGRSVLRPGQRLRLVP
ncbi:transglycosylase SLT domain-containing protein [Xanthomonadaceae bacterium JHOS43]|nr:transglycosylase SLT domain-containing protein [Xanthomonadaceae bacterium JHOS43]MCX7563915.1 transglycosylase SLT domain-containing protein [Xanthomonadaceae bacterium XH05]